MKDASTMMDAEVDLHVGSHMNGAPQAIHAVPRVAGRRSHSERREEAATRMVEAAVQIVASRGLESLTLAECGEAAGYSRGLAAHYFGCKETLIADIATHIVADYSKQLRDNGRNTAGMEALVESIAGYIAKGRSNPIALRAFHAVLGSALTLPSVAAVIADLNRKTVAGFAVLIMQGMEFGEMRESIDPTAHAALIIAGLRGVMTQWLLDPSRVDIESITHEFVEGVRRSLAVEASV